MNEPLIYSTGLVPILDGAEIAGAGGNGHDWPDELRPKVEFLIGPYNPSTNLVAAGCWRPSLIAQRVNANVYGFPTGIADPDYSSVVALYQMQEIYSPAAHQIAIRENKNNTYYLGNGQSQITLSPENPKWGLSSMVCLSTGLVINSATSASACNFSTNDWCMDGWVYFTAVNVSQVIIDLRSGGTSNNTPLIYFSNTNKMKYFFNGVDRITGGTSIVISTWYYFAVARVSGVTRAYLGTSGTAAQEGSTYTDGNTYISQGGVNFGVSGGGSSPLSGYIDECRITKAPGTARYTGGAYTVPGTPYPDY